MPRIDAQLLSDIIDAAIHLNPGDNMSPNVLRAIAGYLGDFPVHRSVETGAGGSTLLFSNISRKHTAFAIDEPCKTLTRVKASVHFNRESTEIVEGPTQLTLPLYSFNDRLQAVLIDGPHAFPFPQLEYFYLYPHMDENGILILDDIHIRTIHELYRFLRSDEMFDFIETVDRTAFFRRTSVPVFDPWGDGWWLQRYNRKRLLRYVWRESLTQLIPERLRGFIRSVPSRVANLRPAYPISIHAPEAGSVVGVNVLVRGRARVPSGAHLWIFARRADMNGWWPQGDGPVALAGDGWEHMCKFGEDADDGHHFDVAAVILDDPEHRRVLRWFVECSRAGLWGPMPLPRNVPGSKTAETRVVRGITAIR